MLDWVGPGPTATVAAEFARRLQILAAANPGRCPIALTGGHSATVFYRALAVAGPPAGLEFFWSDERLVPLDSPDSNFKLAADALLRPANVAGDRVHPTPVQLPAEDCAAAYATEIRQRVPAGPDAVPRFPLIILGLGDDGHTASLFPARDPYQDDSLLVRAVTATPDHPYPRVTFTPRLINAAAAVWFVVTGGEKDWAVRQLAARTADARSVPALVVDPGKTQVTVFRG